MKSVLLQVCIVLFICASFTFQKGQEWRGFVPLHSTRADVERLLGPSADKCKCLYHTQGGELYVEYATDRCKGVVPGWNVPTDTVLRFTLYPNVQQSFSELKLDITKYSVRRDDTFTTFYSSRTEGIEYSVSPEGTLNSISYLPSTRDSGLRCAGFSGVDGNISNHQRFDQYGNVEFGSETLRLDSFAITLKREADLKGYVVVYAGKVACRGEARFRANRARDYLIHKRDVDPKLIVAIDGGFREELAVELYAIARGAAPPNIVPSISTNEVKLISRRKCHSLGSK